MTEYETPDKSSTVVSYSNKTAHLPRPIEKAGGHAVPLSDSVFLLGSKALPSLRRQ